MRKGFFCIEGMDGSGKTTQLTMLLEELGRRGIPALRIREPGGTEISEKIRNIILSPSHKNMTPITELLLYNAARAQLLAELVEPALAQGKIVVADRFAWSTLAYQGFGRQMDLDRMGPIIDAAVGDCWPEITFMLDIPVDVFRQRSLSEGRASDRLEQEQEDFFERVRSGYLTLAERHSDRCRLLDGTRSPFEVHKEMIDLILERLSK